MKNKFRHIIQHLTYYQGYKQDVEKPSMGMGREESIWVHKPQDAETRQNKKCELMEEKGVLGGLLCSGGGWAQEDRTHHHACGSAG